MKRMIYRFLASLTIAISALTGVADAQEVIFTIPVGTNPTALAVNPVTNKVYVANCLPSPRFGLATPGTVTVIAGVHATTTIPVGVCPASIAVNPLTNKIYVANFGHRSFLCGSCFNYGSVTVIDGATNSAVTITDPNAGFPTAVAVNSVTDKIYVANSFTENVTVIDGVTNAMTDIPTVEMFPYDIAVNPVTNKIYVTSFNADAAATNTVTVIDGFTGSSTGVTDPNAVNPISLAVDSVTNKIYVANFGNGGLTPLGSVTIIDGATNSTTNIANPNASNEHAIALNPASDEIYISDVEVTSPFNASITAIGGKTNSFLTITDPNAANPDCSGGLFGGLFATRNLAADPATGEVYVANPCSNNITVIDGTTNSTTTVADPKAIAPIAVAVNLVTHKIYVANTGSNNVTVIEATK